MTPNRDVQLRGDIGGVGAGHPLFWNVVGLIRNRFGVPGTSAEAITALKALAPGLPGRLRRPGIPLGQQSLRPGDRLSATF